MHFILCLYHKCVGCRGGREGKSKECALLTSRRCQRPAGQPWRSPHSPPVEASHRMSWGRVQSPWALRDPRTLRHDPSVGQSRGITASVLSHPSGEWTQLSAASPACSLRLHRLSCGRPPRSTAAAGSLGRPEGSTTDPQRGCGAACRRCKDVGYWPRSAGSRGRIQATQSMAAPRVLGAPGPHGAGLSAWCSRASAPRRVGCNRRDTWLLSARICPLMKDETPSACPCQLLSAPRELRDLKESVG